MAINRVAYFFAGAVLGAAGLAMVKTGKGQELVSGVINGGCGLAENVLGRVETVKEDIEDYMAELKYKAEQAKETAESDEACAQEAIEEEEVEVVADVETDIEQEEAFEEDEESTSDSEIGKA